MNERNKKGGVDTTAGKGHGASFGSGMRGSISRLAGRRVKKKKRTAK